MCLVRQPLLLNHKHLRNRETYFALRIEGELESFYFVTSNPTILLHLELHARMLKVLGIFFLQ